MKLQCECGHTFEYVISQIKNAHRLLCWDSKDPSGFIKLMDGKIAKLVITSPPYNMNGGMYEGYADNLASQDFIEMNLQVIGNVKQHLKGFIFWNISYNKNARWEFIEILSRIVKESGLQFLELITWDKSHALPIVSKEQLTRQFEPILLVGDQESVAADLELYFLGRNDARAYFNKKTNRGITNYWKIGTNNTQIKNKLLACFPVALPTKAITLMTQRGDAVIDSYIGSFSTGIACERTGRVCYGIDADPRAIEISIERFKKLTNRSVVKYEN